MSQQTSQQIFLMTLTGQNMLMLKANPYRKGLIICNANGTVQNFADVFISVGTQDVSVGVPLKANEKWTMDTITATEAIYVCGQTANSKIILIETTNSTALGSLI